MTDFQGKRDGMEETGQGRLAREKKTIRLMVAIYCGKHHGTRGTPCEACRRLLEYALQRIDRCPYHGRKPACNVCPVHCYPHDEREEIRRVMRYAGPRMLFRHPVLAVLHLLDTVRGRHQA